MEDWILNKHRATTDFISNTFTEFVNRDKLWQANFNREIKKLKDDYRKILKSWKLYLWIQKSVKLMRYTNFLILPRKARKRTFSFKIYRSIPKEKKSRKNIRTLNPI